MTKSILLWMTIGLVLAFSGLHICGWLDISTAKINVADIESNIYWHRAGDGGDPYPLTSIRTRSNFEDGDIFWKPDYNVLQEIYLHRHKLYELHFEMLDGVRYFTQSEQNTYEICAWVEDIDIQKINSSLTSDSIRFEVKGKFQSSRLHDDLPIHSHYLRGFLVRGEANFTGFYSVDYLDYKIEQLWLEYFIRSMTQQMMGYDPQLKEEYSYLIP